MNFFGDILQSVLGYGGEVAAGPQGGFQAIYSALPMSMAGGKESLEDGNKILLPQRALEELMMRNTVYPLLFRIVNSATSKFTHCGVMEFSAPEGTVYLPQWIMEALQLNQGDPLFIKSATLPKGKLVTFQPHHTKFTQLSNPRAVLEKMLRGFASLTAGDTIRISHGGTVYSIDVVSVDPDTSLHGICTIETDLKVDFAEPLDYAEYQRKSSAEAAPGEEQKQEDKGKPGPAKATSSYFQQLSGGHRLNGKGAAAPQSVPQPAAESASSSRTVSEVKGQWRYIYSIDPKTHAKKLVRRVKADKGAAFQGKGHTLQ